jgi:peptidoglycan hydrolase CwlO-like protein
MRFSLRDLFWLLLLIAIATAWWHNNRSLHEKYDDAAYQAKLQALQTELANVQTKINLSGAKAASLLRKISDLQEKYVEKLVRLQNPEVERIPVVPPLFEPTDSH